MRSIFISALVLTLFIFGSCSTGQQTEKQLVNDDQLQLENARKELLISTVQAYIKGIKERDFSIIPYSENVTMRTPFTKTGMNLQLQGKEALYNDWWKPLLLTPNTKEVIFDLKQYYFDDSLTSIIAESVVTDYNAEPPATVYVAERFTLNEAGQITDQINFIDVRDVLTPGWYENYE